MRTRRHILCSGFFMLACLLFSPHARAHEGWGIVVDRQGQVYFSDIPTNTIWKVNREGRVEAVATDKHSHALVLDPQGNLYGTHHHPTLPTRSIWKLAPGGQLADVVAPNDAFPLHLQSFLLDAEGNMFSENPYRPPAGEVLLLRRTPDGRVSTLAGSGRGFKDGRGREAQFTRIDGMAFAPDGSLYVADGAFVRRVTSDGTVSTLNREPLTTMRWDEDLMGLAVDERARVYVADYSGRRVLELAPDGKIGRVYETGGLFWSPTGVTVAGEDLYLLEHLRMPLVILGDLRIGPYARIRRVSKDGNATHLATLWGTNTLVFTVVLLVVVALLGLAARALLGRRRRRKRAA